MLKIASIGSSPAKRSKKGELLDALEATSVDDNEANDAHSVGSVGTNAMVIQRVMQSITAAAYMKNPSEMKRYLTQVTDAMNSVTDCTSLPVKNLMSQFAEQHLKDIRLEASCKIDLNACTVDQYLDFLRGLMKDWDARPNNKNEISSLVKSCNLVNLLSKNMKKETSRNFITHLFYEIEKRIDILRTEMGQLNKTKKMAMEKSTLKALYKHLETQMKILGRDDAANLWTCLQKAKPKSSVEENIASQAELLDSWRRMDFQEHPETVEDAIHRFYMVYALKKRIWLDHQAFFGKEDTEESSSSSFSSSSSQPTKNKNQGRKNEGKDVNKQDKTKKSKDKVCYGCGWPGHLKNECLYRYSTKDGKSAKKTIRPDFNDENMPYTQSNKGKNYITVRPYIRHFTKAKNV